MITISLNFFHINNVCYKDIKTPHKKGKTKSYRQHLNYEGLKSGSITSFKNRPEEKSHTKKLL